MFLQIILLIDLMDFEEIFKNLIVHYMIRNDKIKKGRPFKKTFEEQFQIVSEIIKGGMGYRKYTKTHNTVIESVVKKFKKEFPKNKISKKSLFISEKTVRSYFKNVTNAIESFNTKCLKNILSNVFEMTNVFFVDSSKVKNIMGVGDTGRNSTDRGRKGNKTTFLISKDKIIFLKQTDTANKPDINAFIEMLEPVVQNFRNKIICGDKGYIKSSYKENLRKLYNVSLVTDKRKNQKLIISDDDKKY